MLDLATIRRDGEVEAIMEMSERQIEALGFTEHSRRHAGIVSKWSGEILRALGKDEDRVRLVEIAGYLHDIGNCINRKDHAQSGAILAYKILTPPRNETAGDGGDHDGDRQSRRTVRASPSRIFPRRSSLPTRRTSTRAVSAMRSATCSRPTSTTASIWRRRSPLSASKRAEASLRCTLTSTQPSAPSWTISRSISAECSSRGRRREFLGCRFSLVINGTVLL